VRIINICSFLQLLAARQFRALFSSTILYCRPLAII
jgi:hypothetical protein